MPTDFWKEGGRDRLVKLIENTAIPEKRLHPEFDFQFFNWSREGLTTVMLSDGRKVPNCGTLGCLAGELPAVDPAWHFDSTGDLYWGSEPPHGVSSQLCAYFGLHPYEVDGVFVPGRQSDIGRPNLWGDTTVDQVLANARAFLEANP